MLTVRQDHVRAPEEESAAVRVERRTEVHNIGLLDTFQGVKQAPDARLGQGP
jgi:hypothetical protein